MKITREKKTSNSILIIEATKVAIEITGIKTAQRILAILIIVSIEGALKLESFPKGFFPRLENIFLELEK